MRLGKEAMEALQAEICGLLTPGDELVVAGAVALEGTSVLAREKYEVLREHFSKSFLREAMDLRREYGVWEMFDNAWVKEQKPGKETQVRKTANVKEEIQAAKAMKNSEESADKTDHESYGRIEDKQQVQDCMVWNLAKKSGATALYAMKEGGFLSALWKMAEASQVGLEVDFKKIPIRQETIEICEIFDLNPYKLLSDGAILIGIPAGEALVQELRRMGLMAAVIGQTNSGNDRLLYYNENARFLERPGKDEIYKVSL